MSEKNIRPYTWGKFTAPGDVAGMAQAEGGREGHVQISAWQGDDEVIDMSAPPAMLAIISQPLCLKNARRCVLSETMRVGQYGSVAVQGSDFKKLNSIARPCSS